MNKQFVFVSQCVSLILNWYCLLMAGHKHKIERKNVYYWQYRDDRTSSLVVHASSSIVVCIEKLCVLRIFFHTTYQATIPDFWKTISRTFLSEPHLEDILMNHWDLGTYQKRKAFEESADDIFYEQSEQPMTVSPSLWKGFLMKNMKLIKMNYLRYQGKGFFQSDDIETDAEWLMKML